MKYRFMFKIKIIISIYFDIMAVHISKCKTDQNLLIQTTEESYIKEIQYILCKSIRLLSKADVLIAHAQTGPANQLSALNHGRVRLY